MMKEERYHKLRDFSFLKEPFRSAVDDYIADCRAAHLSGWTVFAYVERLRYFFLWFQEKYKNARHLTDINRQMLSDYQMHLWKAESAKGGKLSLATHRARMEALLRFTGWMARREMILMDPGAGFEIPKRERRLPRNYLTQKEMNRLLSACDLTTHLGLRNRAILETMYSTGLRNMELRNLRLQDLNREQGYLTVRAGKGGKDRVAPIGKAALHYIDLYLEKTRPVFTEKRERTELLFVNRHGEKMHQDTLNSFISDLARKARIKRHISAHALRHTCATQMLRGRADIRFIQELLGHRSLASTQIYTRVEIADLKRIHQQCHPREKEPPEEE
jgi:integrase/recombinase XerD